MSKTTSPKGSIWRKWDLHLHSPMSGLANQFPMTNGAPDWDKYVERLESLTDIPVIGITDYFLIEGYKKLKEFQAAGRLKNIQLILPNIEFRLDNSVGGRRINFHVIFSDEVKIQDIEDHFLANLDIKLEGSPWLPGDVRKLKRSSLEQLGAKRKAEHPPFQGESDFGIGCMTAVVKLDQIMEILTTNNLFKERYLTALAEENTSLMEWDGQDHGVRKVILQSSHILFSANPNSIAWCLGKKHSTPEEFAQEFKGLKPCIIGSDAHELDKIGVFPNGKLTWIKSDISFEGLKQIMFEPEIRVRIQQDNPSEQEAYAQIEKLEINFPDDLTIKDQESDEALPFCIQGKQLVPFSSNLTCIIGGRGSGKSSLIHILYNLDQKRDIEKLSEVNSPLFSLQLQSKDGLAKVRSLTKAEIPASTEFFLQNEVERFAKDIHAMSQLIQSRLYGLSAMDDTEKGLNEIEDEWRATADSVNGLVAAYDSIADLDQKILSLEKQKTTLKKQTDVISSTEYKELQKKIEDIANKISAFETFEKEYKTLSQEITTLIKSVGRLDWSAYEGRSVLAALTSELEKKLTELKEVYRRAKEKHDEADYVGKLKTEKASLKKFLAEKGLAAQNVSEVTAATQQIAELEEQIKELQRRQVPFREVYDKKAEIVGAYKIAYEAYRAAFEKVAGILRTSLGDLRFDDQQTKISFQLKTDDQLLKGAVVEFIKANNTSKVPLRSDSIQSVLFESPNTKLSELVADSSKIVDTVSKSTGADVHTQIIQEMIGNKVYLERLHLRMQQCSFDIRNIQVQTRLGEKSLQNTSFGERCGIVIAIVLVAGTNPIIIDQPEDNLDGKYVSNVLVPLIRNQKQKRQIILVTRDANIVIGADSELIVILNKETQGTVLMPATIENKEKRPEYIWILDGGERAFQKREEKYSIQKTA
jgi:energy-coupling factor transporter ATP-binding protein EcfA2